MPIPYPAGEALTCKQVRETDVLAIEHVGIPGIVLMENAGRHIADFIYDRLVDPARDRVLILCGPGNNGGDGFVVARHLRNGGVPIDLALAIPPDKLKGDAATNYSILQRMGVTCLQANADLAAIRDAATSAALILDALLGTGSKDAPRSHVAELIRLANDAPRARRIAVDIPSGLDGDSGQPRDPCFRADATVTMVAAKTGFLSDAARPFVGHVAVVDIGMPAELIPGRNKSASSGA